MKRFFLPWLVPILLSTPLASFFPCFLQTCLAASDTTQTKIGLTESLPERLCPATGKSSTDPGGKQAPVNRPDQTTGQTTSQTVSLTGKKQAVSSLYAKFIQEKNASIMAKPLLSTGFVCLRNKNSAARQHDKQPGHLTAQDTDLFWAYTRPATQGLLYCNGQAMILQADNSLRQPNQREQAFTANIVNMLLLWLDPVEESLASQFQIAENDQTRRRLVLLPRQAGIFRKMTVTFSENRQTLNELLFEEKNGNTLHLTFTDTSLNQTLPDQCQPLIDRKSSMETGKVTAREAE